MPENTTFVLVHGAWSGGWMWWKLTPELEARGFKTKTVDLPTCGAADTTIDVRADAKHVRSVLDAIDGDVILVGNSYGGPVITGASVDAPNVKHLVYLAAFMPDAGEQILQFMSENSTPEFGTGVAFMDDGRMSMDEDTEIRLAFNHATKEDHDVVLAKTAKAMSFGSDFALAFDDVGWRQIPSTYIVCSDDLSCRPSSQLTWAKERATHYVETDFDHCPQVSQPVELAEILASVATKT